MDQNKSKFLHGITGNVMYVVKMQKLLNQGILVILKTGLNNELYTLPTTADGIQIRR